MASQRDTYRTIAKASTETLYKEKGSKFFGYAFPISDEEDVKTYLEAIKKKHYNARHWCYAWQLGKFYEHYRANDDGEPSNSAGMPIYGQLQAFDLTQVLVIVVRYFGGTKLGVGGLIQAYKTAAKQALEASRIITKTIDEEFQLRFEYPDMNLIMRIIKDEDLTIVDQDLQLQCEMTIAVRKNEALRVLGLFEAIHTIKVKKLE